MKHIIILLLSTICINCIAQNSNLLVRKDLIENITDTPIYPKLIEEVKGITKWKNEFAYIDDIEMYSITYLSDGLRVHGLMVKPKEPGNYPCIIYNRGGNREFGRLVIANAALGMGRLAKEGYIVIASQYRGNGGSEGQEEFGGADINDVINLIEVLEEVDDADTERIGMYGWSRGGMMTYRALTMSDQIKVAVVGGAVSDNFASIKDRPSMETKVLAELIPNYKQNKEAELTKRSAIKWVEKFPKNVPILLLHGNADWRVKPEQSLRLAMEFDKYRIPYRLIIYEGGDHGIKEHRIEVNNQVLSWFDKYLKNNSPLPNMEYHGR